MRRPHAVPRPRQVLVYLAELHPLTGPDGYLFPAFHRSRRPMSENIVNQVFRRMGYAVGEITAHNLRTTASALLNESGKWSPTRSSARLPMPTRDAARGTYNRGAYCQERVAMHQWWSGYLDVLCNDQAEDRPSYTA